MKRLIYIFLITILSTQIGHAKVPAVATYTMVVSGNIDGLKITVVNNKVEVNLSDVSFKVYNVLGQEVPNENLKGLYMVKARDKKGFVQVAKIIAM